jgi:hypothetical protein
MGIVAVITSVAGAVASEPVAARGDLNANAALHYWQAFASLPRLDEAQQKKLAGCLTLPLDDEARRLVQAGSDAFRELHHGAALPQCVWGVSFQDGFFAVLQHSSAARQLANLACLRIRLAFAEGRNAAAVDDVLATLTLARHVSTDGTLLSFLVGGVIEHLMLETVAAHLPALDAKAREQLPTRLDRLPPGGTLAACVKTEERAGLDWFLAQVKATKDREALLNLFVIFHDKDRAKAEKLLEACGGTADGVVKQAEALRPIYHEFARKMSLPPEQFDREWNEAAQKMKGNPIFQFLAPALGKCRQADARLQTRRALMKAALAVLRDGPDVLKNHPDPFGDGPFAYDGFEGGFVLRAKMKLPDGKPMTLTVGQRGKK